MSWKTFSVRYEMYIRGRVLHEPKIFDLFKKSFLCVSRRYAVAKTLVQNMKYVKFSPHKAFASSKSTFLALQISPRSLSIFSGGYGLIDKIAYLLIVTRTMLLKDKMNLSNTSIYRNIHHCLWEEC